MTVTHQADTLHTKVSITSITYQFVQGNSIKCVNSSLYRYSLFKFKFLITFPNFFFSTGSSSNYQGNLSASTNRSSSPSLCASSSCSSSNYQNNLSARTNRSSSPSLCASCTSSSCTSSYHQGNFPCSRTSTSCTNHPSSPSLFTSSCTSSSSTGRILVPSSTQLLDLTITKEN